MGFVAAVATVSVGIFSSRSERKSLQVDRAAAQILATFSRVHIQHIALTETLETEHGDFYHDVARRLEELGVLESSDPSDESGRVIFRVTPFGKLALDEGLHQSDRQHIANMESLAAENTGPDDEIEGENPVR